MPRWHNQRTDESGRCGGLTLINVETAQGPVVSGGLVKASEGLVRDFDFDCVIWKAFGNLTFVKCTAAVLRLAGAQR